MAGLKTIPPVPYAEKKLVPTSKSKSVKHAGTVTNADTIRVTVTVAVTVTVTVTAAVSYSCN